MRHPLLLLPLLIACSSDADGPDGDTDAEETILPPPAEPPTYAGTCPDMQGEITGFSSGSQNDRSFIVHLPDDLDGAGILFLWHGNGDSARNFDRYVGGAELANTLKVIVVVPDAGLGGIGMDWAVPPNDTSDDAGFFDDLLGCVTTQYDVDLTRVYSAGFSMGALWTSWLTMHRSEHLAASVIFSGGSDGDVFGMGDGVVNPYQTPSWDIPVLMTEGGSSDMVVVQFQEMTASMSTQLRADGSTVIVCSHDQGHTPPRNYENWSWRFLKQHVFGMSPSPYADGNDPSGRLPNMCSWD